MWSKYVIQFFMWYANYRVLYQYRIKRTINIEFKKCLIRWKKLVKTKIEFLIVLFMIFI